jgi:hypothetical protein
MTKKELKQAIIEFVNRQRTSKDEWWTSDRDAAYAFLSEFAEDLGIKVVESDFENLNEE